MPISVAAQLVFELLLWNTLGLRSFQAATSVAVTSCQTAKRSGISVRHSGPESRCLARPEVRGGRYWQSCRNFHGDPVQDGPHGITEVLRVGDQPSVAARIEHFQNTL